MASRQQQRADFALARIDENYPKGVPKDDASFLAGAPAQILQNGLGQSLAFWAAKGGSDGKHDTKDKYTFTFDTVTLWLNPERKRNRKEIFADLNKMDLHTYCKQQHEALELLQWLKRYGKAFENS